jgi:hypothetical protein
MSSFHFSKLNPQLSEIPFSLGIIPKSFTQQLIISLCGDPSFHQELPKKNLIIYLVLNPFQFIKWGWEFFHFAMEALHSPQISPAFDCTPKTPIKNARLGFRSTICVSISSNPNPPFHTRIKQSIHNSLLEFLFCKLLSVCTTTNPSFSPIKPINSYVFLIMLRIIKPSSSASLLLLHPFLGNQEIA